MNDEAPILQVDEKPLLEVRELVAGFGSAGSAAGDQAHLSPDFARAVDRVSFELYAGKTLGIVGESGSGKSVTALSIAGLLPQPAGRVVSGQVMFHGMDLTRLERERLDVYRGREIGVIFQEPMTALNPVERIGDQIVELLQTHEDMSKKAAWQRAKEALDLVRMPAAAQRMVEYPHQLSGGMRQRVVIALALALRPQLVIADEPTTALDVTVQAQILHLLQELQRELGMAILFITHDFGVISEMCQDVVVLYGGRVVERGSVRRVLKEPRHEYTKQLLASSIDLSHEPKTRLPSIEGQVPSIDELVEGCRFCPRSGKEHGEEQLLVRPPLVELSKGHWVEGCSVCAPEAYKKHVIARSLRVVD